MITYKGVYRTSGIFLALIILISIAVICTGSVTAAGGNTDINPSVDKIPLDLSPETSDTAVDILPPLAGVILPPDILPSTVYILKDGQVAKDLPHVIDGSLSTAERNSRMTEPSASAQVAAQFTVIPTRIIVIDNNSIVLEIWNSSHPDDSFYCLKTKVLSGHGAEHPLTPQIVAQYNSLMVDIDWSRQGRVYPRNPY